MDEGKKDDRTEGLEMQKQCMVRWEGGSDVKAGHVFVLVHWTQKEFIYKSQFGIPAIKHH